MHNIENHGIIISTTRTVRGHFFIGLCRLVYLMNQMQSCICTKRSLLRGLMPCCACGNHGGVIGSVLYYETMHEM